MLTDWAFKKATELVANPELLRIQDAKIVGDFRPACADFCLPLVGKLRIIDTCELDKGLRKGYTVCDLPIDLTGFSRPAACVMTQAKDPELPDTTYASLWKLRTVAKGSPSCSIQERVDSWGDEKALADFMRSGPDLKIMVLVKNPDYLDSITFSEEARMHELSLKKAWGPDMQNFQNTRTSKLVARGEKRKVKEEKDEDEESNADMLAPFSMQDLKDYYSHILK